MNYYGYTKEQIDKVLLLLNRINITGMEQADIFYEATIILRHPLEISSTNEEKKALPQEKQGI